MRAVLGTLILLLASSGASAADSNRIIALEQDVRNLERLVGNLEREVRALRQQRGSGWPSLDSPQEQQELSSDAWLDASKWKSIRPGASEMDVIRTLGRPTSMRVEGDARVLLYAMEIGKTGFLSGSVTLRNGEVSEVERPVLK